jgi:molybdopterin/thiamine biosynthesis adenylyltransferase
VAREAVEHMTKEAIVRLTGPLREELERLLFSRYPRKEWAVFFRFGIRKTVQGVVITIVDLLLPEHGDLNPHIDIVEFREQYTVKAAMSLRKSKLFVGVIHSHPEAVRTLPSRLDDDMDNYFREYFSGFSKAPVYFSLIFGKDKKGGFHFSGRGWIDDQAYSVNEILTIAPGQIRKDSRSPKKILDPEFRERLQRIYGIGAATRLLNSTVVIAGCSGTGSPAAEVLARAGVGRFILVDPERLDKSNLERVHGSYQSHFAKEPFPYKVETLRTLIHEINPHAEVVAIVGNILQEKVRDYLVTADLMLCCTDTNHSRAASGELAYRYLVPSLDVGVLLEGEKGQVSHEVGQITVYSPNLPCAYCLKLVDPWASTVELMSESEKLRRRQEADEATDRGDDAAPYWRDVPALPTVGHFTSLAGDLIASYAIGWLTGTFFPPKNFFQFDILASDFGFIGFDQRPQAGCICQSLIGYADQGAEHAVASAPEHWPAPKILT